MKPLLLWQQLLRAFNIWLDTRYARQAATPLYKRAAPGSIIDGAPEPATMTTRSRPRPDDSIPPAGGDTRVDWFRVLLFNCTILIPRGKVFGGHIWVGF